MSKLKPTKKKDRKKGAANQKESANKPKVVVTKSKNKSAPESSRTRLRDRKEAKSAPVELSFGKRNYILMGVGIGLIFLGLLLMSGGRNVDPNVFDENVIYSFTRITIAPICILAGLIVEIFAIFK